MFSKNHKIVPVKYKKLYTIYGPARIVGVFVARGFIPVRRRSRRKTCVRRLPERMSGAASQPNGAVRRLAKSPRHNEC